MTEFNVFWGSSSTFPLILTLMCSGGAVKSGIKSHSLCADKEKVSHVTG